MATVQGLLHGHLLYDQIYTLYGPFYYLVEWIFYRSTGLEVSHDCVRSIALVLWPLTAAIVAWSAKKVSGSLIVSGFVLIAVTRLLLFFDWEPGHPEEICIVLLACLLTLATSTTHRVSSTKAVAFGALLASLAMTKVNIGLYAVMALSLALLAPKEQSRAKKMFFIVVSIFSLLCVLGIMAPLLGSQWARNYCCVVTLSLAGALLVSSQLRSGVSISLRGWYLIAISGIVTTCLIVLPFLRRGTSLYALAYVSIFQHKDFVHHWFKATPFRDRSVLWAAFSAGVAAAWIWHSRRRPESRAFFVALQLLKPILAGVGIWWIFSGFLEYQVGYAVMMLVGPFSWLVLVPPLRSAPPERGFPRIVLCFFSVFVTLYAFPVAGSQWLFAIVPLTVILAMFLYDAALLAGSWKPQVVTAASRQIVSAAAIVLLAALAIREFRMAHREHAALGSLTLPGAKRIQVPQSVAGTYQWLTAELDANCPSFFSMPGIFSLYFWTRQEPPTMLMMNDWPAFFDAKQQQIIIGDLKRHSTACIVYNPDLVEFLRAGQDLSQSPLGNYIHSEFVIRGQRDGYYFMVRKDLTR